MKRLKPWLVAAVALLMAGPAAAADHHAPRNADRQRQRLTRVGMTR